jgi:hypothetical protein
MKFKIREPFAVHLERVVQTQRGGRTLKDVRVDSHWPGDTVDISAPEALQHLHKA